MEHYLTTLLEQIRCKEAHPYIEKEIRGHIEDQIDANLAAGMPEDVAIQEAIRDMGSPVESGVALDRVHRPAVAWDMLALIGFISICGILIHFFIGDNIPGSSRFATHTLIGFFAMLIVYRLDYSFLATYAKPLALGIILLELLAIWTPVGVRINGTATSISLGSFHVSVFSLLMLYVPIYGAVLYQYYGTGYPGIAKAFLWILFPCSFALLIPNFSSAMILFLSTSVVLSLAVYKGWFRIAKKKFLICFWSFLLCSPILFVASVFSFHWLATYQEARLRAYFMNSGDVLYLTEALRDSISRSQFIGGIDTTLLERLPDMNSNFIFTYLISSYGMIAGILVCIILTILIYKIFQISLKQKNQLGMMIGCGCGTVLCMNALLNIFQSLGLIPTFQSFLPFFSSGGSCIIVSYMMLGLILSIYRYKNIFPIHFDKTPAFKLTIKLEKKNAN